MTEPRTSSPIEGLQIPLLIPQRTLGALEGNGVVYTKRWVVELLLDLAGYKPDVNLVDALAVEPAAGRGAFLGPMVQRLAECCEARGRSLTECENSIVACELDEESANAAKTLVLQILVGRGVEYASAEKLAGAWVRIGDYLTDLQAIKADFVIGNPPYVRLEEIPEEIALFYRRTYRTMSGRADLYIAFYEAALRQLKEGGTCAFICADRWMRNQYGADLRELVTSDFSVDVVIEMHEADAFHDEVDAYPAITVIRRKPQGAAIVARVPSQARDVSPNELASGILSAEQLNAPELTGFRVASVGTWFRGLIPGHAIRQNNLRCFVGLKRTFCRLS